MYAYGLVDPEGVPILKPTALMVSHVDMKSLALTCPGHHKHTVVAGKGSDGETLVVGLLGTLHSFVRHGSVVCTRHVASAPLHAFRMRR